MTSPHPPRRIAAHKLFIDGRLIDRPWVEVDDQGRITARGQWNDLDRMPCTQFFGGILLPGLYAPLPTTPRTLPLLLSSLHQTHTRGLTLLKGIDLRAGVPVSPRLLRLV